VSRSLGPQSAQFSRSRLPLLHSSYSSLVSEASPLPPYAPPLSTPQSRSLPLQILLALFTTLIVLSSVVQFAEIGQGLRHVDELPSAGIADPMKFMVAERRENAPPDPMDSEILQTILDHLDTAEDTTETTTFSIKYNNKQIERGDYVDMDEARLAPLISIEGSGLFTWMLIDIDAPDPQDPTHAPFLHYIVSDLEETHLENMQVVVPYYPVSPPVGQHRYVAFLFHQQGQHTSTTDQSEQDTRLSEQRAKFDVAAYAKDHDLVLTKMSDFYSQPAAAEKEEADR
jgi:phosphatidylethanolamine-binding protein (PEBP) family uncharacterized protein